jgi:cysteine-rich repeat protein
MVVAKGMVFLYSAIIFSLFMMGIASAQNVCSDPSDVMYFKFDQASNYHFGMASNPGYAEVCYSDFFTDLYNGANPQNCNGNNWLFNISNDPIWGATNAHASYNKTPSLAVSAVYNIEVCYGDLDCFVEYGGCTNSDYPPILKFSENSPPTGYNLHGADVGYVDPIGAYPYFLCCNSSNLDSGSTNPGTIEWRNITTGSIINRTRVNTTVMAKWTNGVPFLPGPSSILYENVDGDPLYNSGVDDTIVPNPLMKAVSGDAIVNWTVNDSVIGQTGDYNNFRVQFTRGTNKYATGDLWVSWCGDGNTEEWALEQCDNGIQNGNQSHENYPGAGVSCNALCLNDTYIEGIGSGNLKWQNSSGDVIFRARVDDVVTMNHSGGAGSTDFFNIFEDDGGDQNYTAGTDDAINIGTLLGSDSDLDKIQDWTITLAEANLSQAGDYGEFRFDHGTDTSNNLNISWCGDNLAQAWAGEECDDGNDVDGDGCSTSCKNDGGISETCGNNITDSSEEECDWGAPPTGHNGNSTYLNGDDEYCSYDCYLLDANNLTWRNLDDYAIAKTKFGDSVMLHYNNGENSSGTFYVYEEDLWVFYQDIGEFPIEKRPSPNAYGIWNIPAKSWFDGKTGDFDAFKFEIDGLPKSEKLGILDSLGNSTTNSPPNLTLQSPKCGIDINATDTIDIEFTVFDSDSLISGNVEVDNEIIYKFEGVGGFHSVSHTFNEANTSHIRVYAENANGEKASANSNIIVINRSEKERYFIATCIDEPSGFEFIKEDYIFFNASSTRGIAWYDNGSGIVEMPKEKIGFLWKFSDGRVNSYARIYSDGTSTNGSDPRTFLFYKYFEHQPGDNWAKMGAGFNYTEQF